jgi:Fe-S-cluster containining protein
MHKQNRENILAAYGDLLASVDGWFNRCVKSAGSHITCHTGCSGCCRGLFDITLLDACYLASGFEQLEPLQRERVLAKCLTRLTELQTLWPELAHPYLLNHRPDDEWEELMPDEDETPCVLLSDEGKCLLYRYRPMTCRLHGIPLVDLSGEHFYEDWCTENFTAIDPLTLPDLRWEFDRLFRDELALFREFTTLLLDRRLNELDTFIPLALLIDFGNVGVGTGNIPGRS